jgi:O-antigen/teichoic acid export membrane protein
LSTTAASLLKSSAARIAFSVINAGMAFFMMPFLVDHLGERWYGIWVLVATLVSTSYLLDIGMAMTVIRFMAKAVAEKDTRAANEVVNTCLAIYSVLAGVVFVAGLLVGAVAHRFMDDPEAVRIVRATIVVLGLQYATEFPFKAFAGIVSSYVRYDLLMLSRLLNLIIVNSAFVYLMLHGYGILALAVTVLLADQLSNFLYYRIAKHLFPALKINRNLVRRDLVPQLFSYSSWAFVIQLANQFRFRLPSLLIGWLISVTAVTYFAVGLRLVEYFVDFVYRATNMVTPIFTTYFVQNNFVELRKKYLLLTRFNAILGFFGGGIILIVGEAFIMRWMGPEFEQSYPVLVVLMIAMIFEVVGNYSDNMFYAVSKHKYLAAINVAEAVLNVVLSVALAKPYGIVGVALGTAIPLLFFRIVVIPMYIGRFIGLPTWRYYQNLVPVMAFTVAYLAIAALLSRPFLAVPSYPMVIAVAFLATPLYLITVPFVAFDLEERRYLTGLFPSPLRRWAAFAWGVQSAKAV